MDVEDIKNRYLKAVKRYIDFFQIKYEVDVEYVDSSDLDGILFVSDMYLHFEIIRYCVDNNVYWEVLSGWYYFALDNENKINLKSYRKLRAEYEYKLGFKKFENNELEQWLLRILNNGKDNGETNQGEHNAESSNDTPQP